jgi:hypothetical protein
LVWFGCVIFKDKLPFDVKFVSYASYAASVVLFVVNVIAVTRSVDNSDAVDLYGVTNYDNNPDIKAYVDKAVKYSNQALHRGVPKPERVSLGRSATLSDEMWSLCGPDDSWFASAGEVGTAVEASDQCFTRFRASVHKVLWSQDGSCVLWNQTESQQPR